MVDETTLGWLYNVIGVGRFFQISRRTIAAVPRNLIWVRSGATLQLNILLEYD
ncbi:hypothetical protein M2336_003544 [Sphingobium sp. B1D7B]|nr:hypothetical protein [Sphingobium sp. B1D7B]